MAKKKKAEKVDGFGTRERQLIHAAVRLVWQRSRARALAIRRATDKQGFVRCEKCKKRTPKHHVDHRRPIGEVGGPDYIQKMFVPSKKLDVLCPPCHRPKTKKERAPKKPRTTKVADFY
jgi:Zn finger protein HypA/HybF involved in hydrogenase expression